MIRIRNQSEAGPATFDVILFRFPAFAKAVPMIEGAVEKDVVDLALNVSEKCRAPFDLWNLCLTNHGLGVGVASPDGDFYRVIQNDDSKITARCLASPFYAKFGYVKYVCQQANALFTISVCIHSLVSYMCPDRYPGKLVLLLLLLLLLLLPLLQQLEHLTK